MADWDVVSQTPASPGKADPWAVVSRKPILTRDQEIGEANAKASREEHGPIQDVIDMGAGALKGAGKTASSIGTAVSHPLDTLEAIPGAIVRGATSWAKREADPVGFVKDIGNTLKAMTPAQAGEQLGSLAMGGAAGKAAGVLGDVVGPAAKAAVSGTPKAIEPIVAAARSKGFILKPSQAGGAVGKFAEGVAGSPKLSAEVSIKNQPIANKIVADEVGAEGKLSKESLKEAAVPHNEIYRQVSKLGHVDYDEAIAKDMANIGRGRGTTVASSEKIQKIREAYADRSMDSADYVAEIDYLREAGAKNVKAPHKPEQNEVGRAQLQAAKALERRLNRHAEEMGDFEIMDDYRNAREGLAKINNTREALEGNTGNVSARKLSRLQARGAPLTGNLKLLADLWDHFGESFTEANRVKNRTPVNVPFTLPRIATALTGADVATRRFLMSEKYQGKHIAPGPKKFTLADLEDK